MINRTLLMDLQGTLGGDPIGDVLSFEFYPKVLESLKKLSDLDYRLIILTNQSRIAKGYLSMDEYSRKMSELDDIMKDFGIAQVEYYCCPHDRSEACRCKKPKSGLFDLANQKKEIEKKACYMIGDMGKSDMLLAHHLGIRKILVLTGLGLSSLNEYRSTWDETQADYITSNFHEAVELILELDKK